MTSEAHTAMKTAVENMDMVGGISWLLIEDFVNEIKKEGKLPKDV